MVKNLKQLRATANISQQTLADALGISQQAINRYENHKVEPDIETLIKIADYFNVSVDYLIGRENKSKKEEESFSVFIKYKTLSKAKKACVDTVIETLSQK